MYTANQPPTGQNPVHTNTRGISSEHQTSWRSKFPKLVVLILAIVQLVFTIIIFALEIASLAILINLSTGAGIWCAVPFLIAVILTFVLVQRKDCSRPWATIALIAQLILLIFTFILIGITGFYVETGGYGSAGIYGYVYYTYYGISGPFSTKYQLVQAQLAFGILLMFSGFIYVGIYIFVTIVALWQPYHTLDTSHLFRE